MGWNSDDWKGVAKVIAKVAPALGTIIGGPVGGAIGAGVQIISTSLGVEATPDAVMHELKTNPEALLKIKQAELANERELQKHIYETVQAGMLHEASIIKSLSDADTSGHTTRPKIALMMAWMLLVPYMLIGFALTYVVYIEPKIVKDLWPVLLAYFGVPLGLLRMYFGDLRKEHAQSKGQQVDFGMFGNIFGGVKK
jgi:hypothetical protein